MTASPIRFVWTDEGTMRPLSDFWAKRADAHFVVGQVYALDEIEERSSATHNHYFAQLHEIWQSLPDSLMGEYPTEDILRKHALIMTGFRRERKFAASSMAEARKLAAFLREPGGDDYAIISVNENVVIEWRAMSQSRKAMPEKGQFQRSKQAVLDWCSDLIGLPAPQTSQEAA